MFRDAKDELRRLEAELLAEEQREAVEAEEAYADALLEEFLNEEDEEEILFDEEPVYRDHPGSMYRNYSNNYGRDFDSYNTDKADEDLDDYSEEVYSGGKDSVKGLLITAMCLLIGIFGVLLYLYFRFLR